MSLTAIRIAVLLAAAALIYAGRICLIAVGCVVYIYLLPGIILMKADYPRTSAVFWVCGLTGWLVVPWVLALGFALKLRSNLRVTPYLPEADQ